MAPAGADESWATTAGRSPPVPSPMPLALIGLSSLLGGAAAWMRVRYAKVARARREARRLLRRMRHGARSVEREVEQRRADLRESAEEYAREARRLRLNALDMDELRGTGATNVRWGALREAGLLTVGDVLRAAERGLESLPGVGKASAARLGEAVRNLRERIELEPVELPAASLRRGVDLGVARDTVAFEEARRELAVPLERGAGERAEIEREARELRRASSFLRWSLSGRTRAREAEWVDRWNRLAGRASTVVSEPPLADRAGEEAAERASLADDEVRRRFRERYAECCSLLERFLAGGDDRPEAAGVAPTQAAAGGLPEEVAQRIEQHPLDVAGLGVQLRRYQEFGARFALAQRRVVLGDEMGLGKTIQALAAMVDIEARRPGSRFLVVAPAGILFNWVHEVHARTGLAYRVLYGREFEDELEKWATEGGVGVTSYPFLAQRDLPARIAERGGGVALLVADEAHYVKNPEAQRSQAVARAARLAEHVLFLSGTPMENRPEEMLDLLGVLGLEQLGDEPVAELRQHVESRSPRAFRAAVAPAYLRRNQRDVLTELPERIETEEWVDLSPNDFAAYRDAVERGDFMGMRQAAILGDGSGLSAKLDHLAVLLEDHAESGRKVVVFSYFLNVLQVLSKRFGCQGCITGAMPPKERMELVQAFNAAEGHAILLAQVEAGGQGLNMQGGSVVVLVEPQYKPTTEAQAIARVHRMGQTEKVIVHRLLARDCVDQRLLDLVREKAELFQAYADRSALKDASAQATHAGLARAIVEAERERWMGSPA